VKEFVDYYGELKFRNKYTGKLFETIFLAIKEYKYFCFKFYVVNEF